MLGGIIYTTCAIFLTAKYVVAGSLPHYIKPCPKGPSFDACAVESAKYAVSFLVKGDRQFKIPNMTPLRIPLVDLEGNERFHLKLKNLRVHGLENVQILGVKGDFENQRAEIRSYIPVVNVLADYEMNGRLLVFPIIGSGPCNITLVGGTYIYDFRWELDDRDGVTYAKTSKKSNYDYTLDKTIYRFENLFNGDKLLGEETNKFLNDNWMLVNSDLKQPIIHTLLAIHNEVSSTLASSVPYDEFFL